MTTTHPTLTGAVPVPRLPAEPLLLRPLRLRLRASGLPGAARSLVDGGWWPYSDDLATELPPLLAGAAERGHVVHRITYSLEAWQAVPRKLRLNDVLVRLGGYRTQNAAALHLIDSSGKAPLVLVVVPPATAPAAAAQALHLAQTSTSLDAPAVLDAAGA